MDNTKLAKYVTGAAITAGIAVTLPPLAIYVAPLILPLMTGVLSDKIALKLGEGGLNTITGILGNLCSSVIWESPGLFKKNNENHDLIKLLAKAYSQAIDELLREIQTKPEYENYRSLAQLTLPDIKNRIDEALKSKASNELEKLFPLTESLETQQSLEDQPEKVPFYLKAFGFSPKAKVPINKELAAKISSEDFILSVAEDADSAKEILAFEVELSLRRWFSEIHPSLEFPLSLTPLVFEKLAASIPKYIGELIKTEGFEHSWTAFQRSHLQAILKEVKNHQNGLSDADRELLLPLAKKLDELADSNFPQQLADSTSQILSRFNQSEENIRIFIAEESAKLNADFADLLQGTEARISDKVDDSKQYLSNKIETTFQQSQDADEKRHAEVLQIAYAYRDEQSAKQAQAKTHKPIPNPIPSASDVFDRSRECGDLMKMLAAEDTRLIRIVAPSGYGKTKLVFKFLKSVEARIGNEDDESPADGVLLVNCKDRGNADVWIEILDRAGLMLGRREEFNLEIRGIQSAEQQAAYLLSQLESAGRFWIVLDNFEDLLDREHGTIGRDADDPIRWFFHLVCGSAVNQRLIVTTQHVPAFVGRHAPLLQRKHLIEVGGTPETDAVDYLKTEGADYLLDRISETALLDFARRVDCLPLALVSLLRDLERHFESKPQGRVTVADVEAIAASATHYVEADRENGLRLWLTGQIGELHTDERVVLSVLSVFAKPCPQIALEFILPNFTTEKIERLLRRLERDKLIYQEADGFQLSAIIRDAAYSQIPGAADDENNKLADGREFNKQALHAQAANFYATQRKPAGEWKTLADVQAQLDEIQHRISAKEFEAAAAVLYEIDFDYLFLWGNYRLIIELREQLEGNLPENSFAAGLQANNLGLVYMYTGLVRKSIEQYEKSLQIARRNDDRQNEGRSLGNLGIAYDSLGEFRKAIEFHKQSLAIKRETGDRPGEGRSLGNLGNAYDRLGESRKAIEYHEQALTISREIGDRQGEGNSLANLGVACYSLGEGEKACELWKEALIIYEAIESPNADNVRGWIRKYC